jgi:hypothetical protein
MKFRHVALVASALIFSAPAKAEDASDGLPVAIGAGIPRAGPDVSYLITPLIVIHDETPFLPRDRRLRSEGDGAPQPGRLLAGSLVWGSGFHLTGGLRFQRNKAWALGSPTARAAYIVDGIRYSAADVGPLRARTPAATAAPMVTLGYGGALSRHLALGVEAGALFHASAKANAMALSGSCAGAAAAGYCGGIGIDLDAERLGGNRDIGRYGVYPVVQMRMAYRF